MKAGVVFRITSTAMEAGAAVPSKFTCVGEDASPPLTFADPPAGTVALALVLEDPDAPKGTWIHWTVWDLPVSVKEIPERADIAALGGVEGTTSNKAVGYHGPCPPSGVHRYYFRLYALGGKVGLPRGAAHQVVQAALRQKAIATAEFMGTFTGGA